MEEEEGRFCTPKYFLILLCGYAFTQSFTVGGLFPAVISTLERRYNLSSLESGMLSACYDFSVLLVVIAYGYVGTHGHRPRLLSIGLCFLAAGAFIFALPQVVGAEYDFTDSSDTDICADGMNPPVSCGERDNSIYGVLILGIVLIAFGSAPLYTLGPAHLDYITNPSILPKYLGYFYLFAALGPAMGYIVASLTLGAWVDPGSKPSNVEPGDSNWVGAWWIGWFLAASLGLGIAIPFFLFRRGRPALLIQEEVIELEEKVEKKDNENKKEEKKISTSDLGSEMKPSEKTPGVTPGGSPTTRERKKRQNMVVPEDSVMLDSELQAVGAISQLDSSAHSKSTLPKKTEIKRRVVKRHTRVSMTRKSIEQIPAEGEMKDFRHIFFPLLKNVTYLLTTAGVTTEAFAVSGFSTFLAKAVESIFVLSSSTAALAVGLVIIPGAAGGIYFGGWISNRLRLTPRQNALICWVVALSAIPLLFGFFLGCEQYPLAGMSVRYNPNNNNNNVINEGVNFDATCNSGCGCGRYPYSPVCSNGINYFSACYAGCKTRDSATSFSNCSCVPSNPSTATLAMIESSTATLGKCDSNCDGVLVGFLLLLLLIMFSTFMNNVPATVVSLKCLPEIQRSIGISLQQVIVRALGSVPGPLIFGLALDAACGLWEEKCGERGSCWEYRNVTIRRNLVLLALFPKIASFTFFFLAWWFFPKTVESDVRPGSVIRPKAQSQWNTHVVERKLTITSKVDMNFHGQVSPRPRKNTNSRLSKDKDPRQSAPPSSRAGDRDRPVNV
uniref:Kazal-like domain-containing protein n=1 Tax=Amorphochlora amoebiformis TaxID=1561963 RepID=A0A7S0HA40_9EUKA